VTTILDIHNPWRDALLPAMFDGCPFYVEAGSQEGGRRIVLFEFPKRDTPYAEDMGRKATEFTVRGYCVAFMYDAGLTTDPNSTAGIYSPLYMRDYRIARDILQQRLDTGGQGVLQLPNMARATTGPPMTLSVVCTRYRLTEEERFGGFCTFDMSFVEFGLPPTPPVPATQIQLIQQANNTYAYIVNNIANGPPQAPQ